MELPEPDQDEQVTDFRQHFSSNMLITSGVNFSALLDHDLRCGGRVLATNLTYNKLKELAADCMLQRCIFRYLDINVGTYLLLPICWLVCMGVILVIHILAIDIKLESN